MAYTNLINKYNISRSTIENAINILVRDVWKIDGNAIDILAMTDFLVTGDIGGATHSNITAKYGISETLIAQFVNEISEYVWKATDSAKVQLAIIDLLLNGDVTEGGQVPKYLDAPVVNFTGDEMYFNSTGNVHVDRYVVAVNNITIYSDIGTDINIKDRIEAYNAEAVTNKIPDGNVTITVTAFNDTYNVISGSTTVTYNYISVPEGNYLNAPTLAISSDGTISISSNGGNVPVESFELYYGDDYVSYFNIGQTKNVADVVDFYGTITFNAVAVNNSLGVVSNYSNTVQYRYVPDIVPTTISLVDNILRINTVPNASAYDIYFGSTKVDSFAATSSNYISYNMLLVDPTPYLGTIVTITVKVGYSIDGDYEYSSASNAVYYEFPSQTEPSVVTLVNTVPADGVDSAGPMYVYVNRPYDFDWDANEYIDYDEMVDRAHRDSDTGVIADSTLEFYVEAGQYAYVCGMPYETFLPTLTPTGSATLEEISNFPYVLKISNISEYAVTLTISRDWY